MVVVAEHGGRLIVRHHLLIVEGQGHHSLIVEGPICSCPVRVCHPPVCRPPTHLEAAVPAACDLEAQPKAHQPHEQAQALDGPAAQEDTATVCSAARSVRTPARGKRKSNRAISLLSSLCRLEPRYAPFQSVNCPIHWYKAECPIAPVQLEPQRVSLLHCAGDDNAQRDEHAPAEQQQPEVGLQGRGLGGMGVVLLQCCCMDCPPNTGLIRGRRPCKPWISTSRKK